MNENSTAQTIAQIETVLYREDTNCRTGTDSDEFFAGQLGSQDLSQFLPQYAVNFMGDPGAKLDQMTCKELINSSLNRCIDRAFELHHDLVDEVFGIDLPISRRNDGW